MFFVEPRVKVNRLGYLITGPRTHSVVAVLFCSLACVVVCCRLYASLLTLHGGPAGGFTGTGQAMTSCRLQSNYSSTVTLHGGPVVLRPVRATPCYLNKFFIVTAPAHCVRNTDQLLLCKIRIFLSPELWPSTVQS